MKGVLKTGRRTGYIAGPIGSGLLKGFKRQPTRLIAFFLAQWLPLEPLAPTPKWDFRRNLSSINVVVRMAEEEEVLLSVVVKMERCVM